MSPSPVVREVGAPRRGAIAPVAGQTQSETRSSMGPVGQVKRKTDKQTDTKTQRQTQTHKEAETDTQTLNNTHTQHRMVIFHLVDFVLL